MRLTDLTGHPVIATGDANELGRIENVVIDPEAHRIQSFKLSGTSQVLPVEAARSVGADAVMVEDGGAIREPRERVEQRAVDNDLTVIGARVLSDLGNELGTLVDLDFDADTGEIDAVAVGNRRFDGHDVVGVGTFAVVVRDPNPDAEMTESA